MYLNFQQYRISPLLTVCNYDYVLMSLTLPDGVKRAYLHHEGKELSHMRYDKRVPSGGGALKGPAVGVGICSSGQPGPRILTTVTFPLRENKKTGYLAGGSVFWFWRQATSFLI